MENVWLYYCNGRVIDSIQLNDQLFSSNSFCFVFSWHTEISVPFILDFQIQFVFVDVHPPLPQFSFPQYSLNLMYKYTWLSRFDLQYLCQIGPTSFAPWSFPHFSTLPCFWNKGDNIL